MKNVTLFVILTAFLLAACGAAATATAEPTSPPLSTKTQAAPPTETPAPPTATLEPSPTPTLVPLGGGGRLILKVNPLLIPKGVQAQKPANWLSAASDGTDLTFFDWQIWSLAPDGKRALTYTGSYPHYQVILRNLDGTGAIPLDDSLNYAVQFGFLPTALWQPNGNVILLASEPKQKNKTSAYLLSPDGKLTKWEKLSQLMKDYTQLLAISPNGEDLYWSNDLKASNKIEYYLSKLDDSAHKRIFTQTDSFQDLYISPSGRYIVYLDNSHMVLKGCFIYSVADGTTTKITPEDGSNGTWFCGMGNHWSPTEDKLFATTPTGYSMLNVPDGKITTFAGVNAGSCYLAAWTPDGKQVFLSVCTEKNSYRQNGMGGMARPDATNYWNFIQSIGARLIDISDGKVTEYPDAGLCTAAISPDSKWVLFYLCKNENGLVDNPARLLNLETKEMVPVFQGFVSDDPKAFAQSNDGLYKGWSVFWVP
jgi:hypothetical protein